MLARELLSTLGLARWRRDAHPLESAHWTATLASFDCRVRVLESRHIASPCTWGVIFPVLLLPSAGDAWSESARRSALLHELAHLQRRDALSSLVSRLACVLHWYNPLVWFAAARARNLQERACDDAVLRAGTMPSDYAQFVLDVAAHMSGMGRPHSPAIGMTHSSLRTRLVAILDPQARRSRPARASAVASCSVLFAITILIGMTSVAAVPDPPPVPAKLPTLPLLPTLPTLPRLAKLPVPPAPPVPSTPPERRAP
jgi:beta-lactamase regulating signal transducer with metallopeptidase domain